MARQLNRLSPRTVATVTTPGLHADGGGLYLVVDKAGAKRWTFVFAWRGKRREMGLGSFLNVSQAKAREKAEAARKLLGDGKNPIDVRRAEREVPLFGAFADTLVAELSAEFRNEKHRKQWTTTLETHAAAIRSIRVDEVTTDDVLLVLKPIWTSLPETASRVRGRIERVLDGATARGFRSGENPARWRGHMANLLPKRQKLSRGHHKAMPYAAVPSFTRRLRGRDAVAARALEFLILTAARSGEVLGARWDEIDLEAKVWVVPASRMKAGREHRVPLTDRAVEILEEVQKLAAGDFVFPGQKDKKPLSVMSLAMVLRRLKVDGVTVHGFRSAFRDWVSEETSHPRELAEAALAHTVGDATERAYRRGDALERRRELMRAWAAYCEARAALKVVGE